MAVVSRRRFFGDVFSGPLKRAAVDAGLEEQTGPLSRAQVAHLFHRACFVASPLTIDKYVGKTAGELVDMLFANAHLKKSPTPLPFVNDVLRNPINLSGSSKQQAEELLNKHRGDYNYDLGGWWVTQMKNDTESILEKLVFFWHGHLTTQFGGCESIPAVPMYLQNDLFRKNFAGNFYQILEKITIDGAMLVYLNGLDNVNESPNENYARELLELYSLGVGNYSETDVKEAAKILTGWKMSYFTDDAGAANKGYLNPAHFDKNAKRFFEENFVVDFEVTQQNVLEKSVRKLIQVILNKKGTVASRFMMTKFYRYFVYSNPDKTDEKIIGELASKLIENKFEFEPVLKTLLKSRHFFHENNIGIQLKSPGDTIINMIGHFKYVDNYARNVMSTLGMELFNPPNVGGWKGYRSWVSTKSMPTTAFYIHEIFGFNTNTDFANWAEKIDNSGDLEKLVSRILEVFFGRTVDSRRFAAYSTILATNSQEWATIRNDKNTAGQRVKLLLENVIKAPEFYLS